MLKVAITALSAVVLLALPAQGQSFLSRGMATVTLRGDRVSIFNPVGDVELLPASDSSIVVQAEFSGGLIDQRRLSVRGGSMQGGGGYVAVLFPTDRIIYAGAGHETEFVVVESGIFGPDAARGRTVRIAPEGSGFDAHADLTVHVPEGTSVSIFDYWGTIHLPDAERRANGALHANGIRVRNVHGELEFE